MQISIATKDKPSLHINCSRVFAASKRCHNTKMTQRQEALILQEECKICAK